MLELISKKESGSHYLVTVNDGENNPLLAPHEADESAVYCNICLDKKESYLSCADRHAICLDACFPNYVELLCKETFRLRANKGFIGCPVPNCTSGRWNSGQVRESLAGSGRVLDLYTDTLLTLVAESVADAPRVDSAESSADRLERYRGLVRDSLTLKCPNPRCRLAVDPSPDGCASVKCLKCGCYYCMFCFESSGISSQASHTHVQFCAHSPIPGALFVPIEGLADVHKARKIEAIRRSFLAIGKMDV